MRFSRAIGALAAAAFSFASGTAAASLLPRQSTPQYAGYLVTTFAGKDSNIYQYLSNGNNAGSFRKLPVRLSPKGLGTEAARDPYLVSNGKGDYYILATDLDIYKVTNWDYALRHGSRQLFVWHSKDLITWSATPSLVTVEAETAGMAWAPSAIWNEREGVFDVFWASRFYAESDKGHTGKSSLNQIRTAKTKDFKSFSNLRTYIDPEKVQIPLIDQEFLKTPGGWVRFLKDESRMRIIQEISHSSDVFGNDWTRVGDTVVDKEREGAAAFADNLVANKFHVWIDNYGFNNGVGSYEAYETTDIAKGGWEPSTAGGIPVGMRHGCVTQLTQAQYDALNRKYPA